VSVIFDLDIYRWLDTVFVNDFEQYRAGKIHRNLSEEISSKGALANL
jgi:hypothetical protein